MVRLLVLCVYKFYIMKYIGKGLKRVNSKKKLVHLRNIIYSISEVYFNIGNTASERNTMNKQLPFLGILRNTTESGS